MMTVEGLDVVRDRIANKIQQRLPIAINFLVMQITDDLVVKARTIVGKDTGALDKSIHKNIVERSIDKVEIDVVAGDPSVARGVSPFETDTQGNKVGFKPTSEYAAAHESKQAYMGQAFSEAKDNIKSTIKNAFDKVFGV